MGRFERTRDEMVQVAVMAAVLRTADPEHPEAVTQRNYNAARAIAGHPDSTRADKLVVQLGVRWDALKDLVLNRENPSHAIAVATQRSVRRVLTSAEASSALRRVAASIGTNTLEYGEYENARKAMQDRAALRHRHGWHLLPLPHASVIAQRHGGWS